MKLQHYILSIGLLCTLALQAQQDAQYTQYMYNTIAVNPGYTGSRGALSIAALHRSQWVGLDGAPTTQTFNVHAPISRNIGLGLSVVNDEIGNGTNQDTYFDALISYSIKVSAEATLSFGMKAGGHFLNIDFNRLRDYNPTVPPPNGGIDHKFSPNFGAGLYYHESKFYLGFSVPNFLRTQHFDGTGEDTSYVSKDQMNWYLISGYVFDLNQSFKLKPAILFKAVNGAPLQTDLSATVLFNDKISLGGAYRWGAGASALFGLQATQRLMLGLAYDKETTALGGTRFNAGSFEVFLRYEFRDSFKNALTPRFF